MTTIRISGATCVLSEAEVQALISSLVQIVVARTAWEIQGVPETINVAGPKELGQRLGAVLGQVEGATDIAGQIPQLGPIIDRLLRRDYNVQLRVFAEAA